MVVGRLVRDIISHESRSGGYRFDEVKISGLIAVVFACWMVGYRVIYLNDQFDAYSFLLGMGLLVTAMSGGPALRDRIGNGGRQPLPADYDPPRGGRQL